LNYRLIYPYISLSKLRKDNLVKTKSILLLALITLAFNPTTAILDEQSGATVDISGRWVDDRDQVDIKQKGNVVTGEIGVVGSSFSGTRNGDVITFTLIYKLADYRGGRKSEGELKINSDGTRLTGTRSGGAFRKDSEWILEREN
jgi:hypothetical protein